MTKAISNGEDNQQKVKKSYPKIHKENENKTTEPEDPAKARNIQKHSQKDFLRKIYQKVLEELKNKGKNQVNSINEFLSYLKKNPEEVN